MNHTRFLLPIALFFLISSALHAQPAPGTITVGRVQGSVTAIDAAGVSRALAQGAAVRQGETVETAAASSAVLVLSTGATVTLRPETRMAVDEFNQDPFTEWDPAGDDEPSRSTTRLNVAHGELIGNVMRLQAGSVFEVNTPVGVAGVRGTSFLVRVTLPTVPGGRVFVEVVLSTGSMYFASAPVYGLPAHDIEVEQEFTIEAEPPTPGAPPPPAPVINVRTVTEQVNNFIQNEVGAAIEVRLTEIPPAPPPPPPPPTFPTQPVDPGIVSPSR